ncbi:hypothetical protein F4821DRAFT_273075 [Hypoxylon rubiginosum]|uniref:Uncharacterized protein n=1 Tax=Hypoxylon rubiginosum TaxID=110542 RepID=A0ACC0CMI7_9PEZI|nr:hypothetical protein F4821DRAFT_273075 [Hypoxylon rubiginosum]
METHRDVPDRGPNLLAALWTCCSLACVFLSLRVYCKFQRHVALQYDDYLLIVSWTTQLVCSVLVSINVAAGFGKYTADVIAEHGSENIVPITLRETIVGFLMTLAIAWSKTSFAVTLLRVTPGRMKAVLWTIIVTMNVFMTVGALSIFLQCSPVSKSWDEHLPGMCWPTFNLVASMFSSAYSALMDFVLALLPWPLIWHLKMKVKERIGVAVAMSMGICAGATAIVKCYYLQRPHGMNFFYEGGNLVIWGSAEVATTIMAASIPVLRVFVRDIRESVAFYRHSGSFRDALRSLRRKQGGESGQEPPALRSSDDRESDKIAITRTQELRISFHNRIEIDGLRLDAEEAGSQIYSIQY